LLDPLRVARSRVGIEVEHEPVTGANHRGNLAFKEWN
jgi:hypothetical protein